jgi:hypothetical protein
VELIEEYPLVFVRSGYVIKLQQKVHVWIIYSVPDWELKILLWQHPTLLIVYRR